VRCVCDLARDNPPPQDVNPLLIAYKRPVHADGNLRGTVVAWREFLRQDDNAMTVYGGPLLTFAFTAF